MENLLDYLLWRGDLSLAADPFNNVDFLILCRMSYVPFDGVVSPDFTAQPITIADAAEEVLRLAGPQGDGRDFRMRDDEELMRLLRDSKRFASLGLIGFENTFRPEQEEQFSAITVLLPGDEAVIDYRGTDGTIVGWKEDFNMAFSEAVPAQKDALDYLQRAAQCSGGSLRLGGHSKGGNLAVYAAAFCTQQIQDRITQVRNFDGPGFSETTFARPELQNIMDRTHTLLPQSSVIGMLLEHAEDFSIVGSRSLGIYQHNPYMWEVERNGFVSVEALTNSSQFMDATMKQWIMDMPPDLREKMINGLFHVFADADVHMLNEIWNGKRTLAVIKAYGDLDEETRQVLSQAFVRLKGAMKSSLPTMLERLKLNVRVELPAPGFWASLKGKM